MDEVGFQIKKLNKIKIKTYEKYLLFIMLSSCYWTWKMRKARKRNKRLNKYIDKRSTMAMGMAETLPPKVALAKFE